MKSLRSLLWLLLFFSGLTGVVFPCLYLYTASQLPQLESEYDLEKLLRLSIEGERRSVRAGRADDLGRSYDWPKPEFARLPHDLIALYISEMGCPNFFRTPREDGLSWAWREFAGMFGADPPGDGSCERYLALRLASAIGIQGDLQLAVASNKIHAFMQKDELVAYDFGSMWFEQGVIGVEDAAWELYRKKLSDLTLAELAEFTLALPIHGYYGELKTCKNASIIKKNRNVILDRLGAQGLVAPATIATAQQAPVACLRSP